jgi:integrase
MEFAASSSSMLSQWSLQSAETTRRASSAAEETLKWSCYGIPRSGLVQCLLCRMRRSRHTCAMVILQATRDIRKVSLWLGHSNLTTTEVYVRADPSEKLEAIEAVVPPSLRKGKFRPPDKLLALLKTKS